MSEIDKLSLFDCTETLRRAIEDLAAAFRALTREAEGIKDKLEGIREEIAIANERVSKLKF